ncbi:MAG: DUF1573 domain-containing protein [Pirellulales bacterium]|nr:DUF1573 domain-containing protein [Pirellulales bacterium]
MKNIRGLYYLFAVVVWMLSAHAARGQEWAVKMFGGKTTHDFGVVARGAKVEHRFLVENIYEEEARIQSVASSCGCSTARATRQTLKTWEQAEIVVAMDTRGYLGRKDATITVVFDLPFRAEVQLHVHSFIRGDVVVQPGAVEFGSVVQGTAPRRVLKISYAGRNDWRIERVESANPHIEARAVENNRATGRVEYDLMVRLKEDAPPGYIRDRLILVTNDGNPRSARVPVPVEGVVTSELTVRPSPLLMGIAEAGKPVTRNLVVQGGTAFRILAARSSNKSFSCKIPDGDNKVHVVPVTFLADGSDAALGKAATKIVVETDSAGSVEVDVSIQVAPPKPPRP